MAYLLLIVPNELHAKSTLTHECYKLILHSYSKYRQNSSLITYQQLHLKVHCLSEGETFT